MKNNKGFLLVGMMISILIIGLLFAYYINGDKGKDTASDRLNSNGVPANSQNQIEEYRGNIKQAEDIKNLIESRNSVNVNP